VRATAGLARPAGAGGLDDPVVVQDDSRALDGAGSYPKDAREGLTACISLDESITAIEGLAVSEGVDADKVADLGIGQLS
jgi:hypothetical protein